MKVLVTGGAGFIGSTVQLALLDAGHEVVVLDDLSTGRAEYVRCPLVRGDVGDPQVVADLLDRHPGVEVVVHAAARAVVADSVADPVSTYEVNVGGTVRLLRVLADRGIRRVIFSSSASLYEPDAGVLADESSPVVAHSPYARSKVMAEQVLADLAATGAVEVLALRYVTPLGADPQLRSGLQPHLPWRVMGMLLECLRDGTPFPVLGGSWPTPDGTPVRDFVHVWDLARAHVAAVDRFDMTVDAATAFRVLNVSTGRGTSVLELVRAWEAVCGTPMPLEWRQPRPGDTVGGAVSSALAQQLLDWRPTRSVQDALRDGLRWAEHCAPDQVGTQRATVNRIG